MFLSDNYFIWPRILINYILKIGYLTQKKKHNCGVIICKCKEGVLSYIMCVMFCYCIDSDWWLFSPLLNKAEHLTTVLLYFVFTVLLMWTTGQNIEKGQSAPLLRLRLCCVCSYQCKCVYAFVRLSPAAASRDRGELAGSGCYGNSRRDVMLISVWAVGSDAMSREVVLVVEGGGSRFDSWDWASGQF